MGGSKTKTVGGGAATPVATDWNAFLLNGLNTGNFNPGGSINGSPVGNQTGATTSNTMTNAFQQGMQNNPTFGSSIMQMLGGGAHPNLPNQPGYSNPNTSQLNTGLNLSGFNFNPAASQAGSNQFLNNIMGGGQQAQGASVANSFTGGVPDFFQNMQNFNIGVQPVDMSNPQFAAASNLIDQQNKVDLANLRARFGAAGGNGLSTGASQAESQFDAQAPGNKVLALGQLQNQLYGQNINTANTLLGQMQAAAGDTANRLGLASNSQLGNRNIQSGENIASAGNATQASIANANNALQGNSSALQYLLGAGNLGLNSAQFNAGNALNQFGANNNAMQMNNQNAFNNANMSNQFGLNLFGQNSSNALNSAQMQNQSIAQMLSQLFNSYQQSNQLGTPQAQTVQTPSPFSQILGAVGQGLNLFNGFKQAGNPFGTSSGMPAQAQGYGSPGYNGGLSMPTIPQPGFTPSYPGASGNYSPYGFNPWATAYGGF